MIRNSTNEISIKPRVSNQAKVISLVFALLVLAALVYFAYYFGVRSGNSQYEQDEVLIKQLNGTISTQQTSLDTAEQQLIFAQRQKQIQEEAYKQMSAAYASSEQKNQYLGSRLDFYRSIISPEGGESGPAIQAIDYRQESANIAFDITLVQAIKHQANVTGDIVVELLNGESVISQWPESGGRSVNYQYFQQISGVFESATTLENASIKVTLNLRDGTSIENTVAVDIDQSNGETD